MEFETGVSAVPHIEAFRASSILKTEFSLQFMHIYLYKNAMRITQTLERLAPAAAKGGRKDIWKSRPIAPNRRLEVKHYEPAATLIKRFDESGRGSGTRLIADNLGIARTTVDGWRQATSVKGRGGVIPKRHHAKLKLLAQDYGIEIDDLLEERK